MNATVIRISAVALALIASISTTNAQELTQDQTCSRFLSAVVPIQTERELGTGFIVSPDGWIITAAHVVINLDSKQPDKTIRTVLPDGGGVVSVVLESPNNQFTWDHDFALLKAKGKNLPFLQLGNENNLALGSDAAIIGFPWAATNRYPLKFCLSASIASRTKIPSPSGVFSFFFFQGPSIKGISGSPVISRANGQVIGIVDTSLAGISPALRQARKNAEKGTQIRIGSVNYADVIMETIDVLDDQLANGLGGALGINPASEKLAEAEKQAESKSPQ